MQNQITSAITAAFNVLLKGAGLTPRYKLTEERVLSLRKIHGTDAAFLVLSHNFFGGNNYRIQAAIERKIREYVPDEIAAKWAERDARKSTPLVQINERVAVRYNPRTPRKPFNTFRVVA